MAITVYTNNQYYSDIADAIRNQNGTNNTYTPAEMAEAIDGLSQRGGTIIQDANGYLVLDKNIGNNIELVYNWDFTKSLTDTIGGFVATISGGTQDSMGVHLTAANQYITFNTLFPNSNATYELDISSMNRQGSAHGRFFMYSIDSGFIYSSTGKWALYQSGLGGWNYSTITDKNYFAGHTLKVVYDNYCRVSIYRDNDFVMDSNSHYVDRMYRIGMNQNGFYNVDITALRIYNGDTTK